MKKIQLIIGIALLIITTILVVAFPFAVSYSKEALALLCICSMLGYIGGFLLIDSYLTNLEYRHYTIGYNDGLKDAASDVINVYNSTH